MGSSPPASSGTLRSKVADHDGRPIGTAIWTPYGREYTMAGMRREQSSASRRPGAAERPTPVRVLAYIVYSIGTTLCLVLMVGLLDRLANGAPWPESVGLLGILIPWWITAGLGVRLGLEPYEYLRSLGRILGLVPR